MSQINVNEYEVCHLGTKRKRGSYARHRPITTDVTVYHTRPTELYISVDAARAAHFYRVASDITAEEMIASGWSTRQRRTYKGKRKTALLRICRHRTRPNDFIFVLAPFTNASEETPRSEYVVIHEYPSRHAIVARIPLGLIEFPPMDPKKLRTHRKPVAFRSLIHLLVENNGNVAFYANEWDWVWKPRGKSKAETKAEPEIDYEKPELRNLPYLG